MKIYIVRHGDPDYANDTLTEHGWREAELLAPRFSSLAIKDFYVSPLGRAKDTASCTLKAMNRTAVVCDWLREFPAVLDVSTSDRLRAAYPDTKFSLDGSSARIVWDMMPEYLNAHPEYLDRHAWRDSEVAKHSDLLSCYDYVISEFDRLLASHGYERQGDVYHAVRPNRDAIVFFCHYGLECVLLSRLLNISPFALWSGAVFAPTSVSLIRTEERAQGFAYWRAAQLGDVSHLYAAGLEPSFSARFCETYDDWTERH